MNFKVKMVTAVATIGFITNSYARSYILERAVNEALVKYPELKKEDVSSLAITVDDWVMHFEQAVVLGTTFDYEEDRKLSIFNNVLAKKEECSANIALGSCARELVCSKKVFSNFASYFWDINCK